MKLQRKLGRREVLAAFGAGVNPTSNGSDNVFSDGTSTELATVTGSGAAGYTAALTIGVAV